MTDPAPTPGSARRRGLPRPLRVLSLRARITIGSTAIAAVVIVLLVLVMRVSVVSVVASATRTLLDADVDPYVATLEVDSDPDLSAPGNAQLVAVVAPSGQIRLSTMPPRVERALGSLTSRPAGTSLITVSGSEYRVVIEHPVNQAGRWTVVAARNSQAEAIVVDDLTTTLSLTGLAILIAFGIASWALATAALRPVNRMRREAERLSVAPERAELPVGPAQDELASLATTLNAFLARTRQATERERQMVSDASHELRTPLAILTTQLDLASLDGDDAAALAAHIDRAKRSVARLSRLANDLLTLSRIEESERHEQDGAQATTSWSDLGDEVMAAVDRVRLIASAKDVTVDFDLEPPAPTTVGSSVGVGTARGPTPAPAARPSRTSASTPVASPSSSRTPRATRSRHSPRRRRLRVLAGRGRRGRPPGHGRRPRGARVVHPGRLRPVHPARRGPDLPPRPRSGDRRDTDAGRLRSRTRDRARHRGTVGRHGVPP